MAPQPKGIPVDCPHCGTQYLRRPSDFKFQKKGTCGASECKTKHKSGENNPFWGKSHSPKAREKIRAHHLANPNPNPHRNTGYRHTAETRAKMSEAVKNRWAKRRDEMIQNLPRGEDHHRWMGNPETIRHQHLFGDVQKREWTDTKCAWIS